MSIDVAMLPTLNATLNATAVFLLAGGFAAIRGRKTRVHVGFMIAALVVSSLFLTSYVVYHMRAGHTAFTGTGAVRDLYFFILISHVILAIAIVPLVIMTVYRAARSRYDAHRRIARWTLPLWLYVSITGVLVYLMLYQLYPAGT